MSQTDSRFVVDGDDRVDHFVFDIHADWWSRFYEYAWAAKFVRPDDIALDAACGVCHPLKFYLADNCREAHACDMDKRLLSDSGFLEETLRFHNEEAAQMVLKRRKGSVHFSIASLSELPYADKTFDRVYCISVLEHLDDAFNGNPAIRIFAPLLRPFLDHDVELALREFRRVLKDDGLVVLTFDYPRIDLKYFDYLARRLDFEFAGGIDYGIPDNALHWDTRDLRCFRALLRKKATNM